MSGFFQAGEPASVSQEGTLVYLEQPRYFGSLVLRNRRGHLIETISQPRRETRGPAISPDGQQIAASSFDSGEADIWIHDLIRPNKTKVTFDVGPEIQPTWSPSGQELVYVQQSRVNHEVATLMRKTVDGTGEAVTLAAGRVTNPDWSSDGRYLAYQIFDPETLHDIRYLDLEADRDTNEPLTFLGTLGDEREPKLSPDGRLLAYVSAETGRPEVYVRPFPDVLTGQWQVSMNGGAAPRWRGDGKELYYVEAGALMAVSVSTEQGFITGQPRQLFESNDLIWSGVAPPYDVSADGQRFVTVMPVEGETTPPTIRVVENWYEEFREQDE